MDNVDGIESWRTSPTGVRAYIETRAKAQSQANETGFDHGLEANDLFKSWNMFMLPRKENRRGHELRCEVVYPERNWKPGHGPYVADKE